MGNCLRCEQHLSVVQLCNCAMAELPNAELPLHIRYALAQRPFVPFDPLAYMDPYYIAL